MGRGGGWRGPREWVGWVGRSETRPKLGGWAQVEVVGIIRWHLGKRTKPCLGPFANIRESRLQNHCVNQSNESRMTDCIGILYSDSEFMDLTPSLIIVPPVTRKVVCQKDKEA